MPRKGLREKLVQKASGYLHYFGLALIVASMPLLAAGLGGLLLYGVVGGDELRASIDLLFFGLSYAVLGFLLSRLHSGGLTKTDAVMLTVFIWVATPLLNAIPFSLALRIDLLSAFFESVSGWTTTGLSILTGETSEEGIYYPTPEELPGALAIWRSAIQWIGGVGIVVFTIAFLARPGISAAILYLAEGRFERLEISFKRSALRMAQVYAVYTVVSALMLYLAGMTPMDAVLHAMTGIATGGFSTHIESVGFYKGQYLIYATSLMAAFIGATSFSDLDNILNLRLRRLLSSPEFKGMLAAVAFVVATTVLLWLNDDTLRSSYTLADALYNSLSALSNVGFGVAPVSDGGDTYMFYLIIVMFIGGSAFSTAGGIKILRLVIIERTIRIEVDMITKPRGYVPKKRLGGHTLDEKLFRKTLAVVASFIVMYGILMIASLILYGDLYDTTALAFEVASALTNMGQSSGVTSPLMPDGLKIIMIVAMLMGRLEVLPFIIAVFYLIDKVRGR